MSTHDHSHDDHSHGDHGAHAEPTSFYRKYIYSTDHKIIGLQFLFTSLLFVLLGGALALGVRYQLAWPNQNVPFASILPGKMTQKAPEANPSLWKVGHPVEFAAETTIGGTTLPAGTKATFSGFSEGIAVTLPMGTILNEGGSERILAAPEAASVASNRVMGDYDYAKQQVRAIVGTTVTVGTRDAVIKGLEVWVPDGNDKSRATKSTGNLMLPIRVADTKIKLAVAAQEVTDPSDATKHTTVAAVVLEGDKAVVASAVVYNKEQLTTDAYLQLFTMHASIMIFFVIIPSLIGAFGNFCVPIMIGAKDMAFPRLNALSFWLSVPAGFLMLLSFWTPAGAAGGGWTNYPTLSTHAYSPNWGTTIWIASVGLVGFSSVVGALNYITTIINMRCPGMSLFRMPLTVWSVLITATLALFSTPVLTAAMIMLLLDRVLGTMFFEPTLLKIVDGVAITQVVGGQPLLWQHLFWFYSHPAVYIMILPAMGIVSDVLATFSRKPVFGYRPMIFAICAIAFLGFIVWGHHMFQSGMNPVLGTTFMASTIMIAVPSAIKTFNWLGTLWGGNLKYTPAMLNALGFVSMFVIGGLSGIFMASAPVDIHIHDTYFIVAHIHYVVFGGSIFGIFAGVYYWYPKMFGKQMNQRWGVIHFWMNIIAFNLTFFTMHILGVGGHPRRYASIMEYPTLAHLQPMNVLMTFGALMLGMAQLPFMYNFFVSLPRKAGRAITAFFLVMLTAPSAMGLFAWSEGATAMRGNATLDMFAWFMGPEHTAYSTALLWGTIKFTIALLAVGAVWSVGVVAAVWIVWAVGGAIRMTSILNKSLYVVFLPAFLCPLVLKTDFYFWVGNVLDSTAFVALYDYRWIILALTALPGTAYLLIARPKDEFGAIPGDNPWHANSLEWCTSSPPPFTNFHEIPTVYRGPYEFSSPAVKEDYLTQTTKLAPGVVEPAPH